MALPLSNSLIDKLPSALRARFLAAAEPVALPLRTSIFSPDKPPKFVHFITSGAASIVATMESGDGIEIGLVGREGAPESLFLLGPARASNDCFIQIAGTALRIDFKRFQEEFFLEEPMLRAILQHVQYTSLMMGQIAACNRLHDVEERTARWLLMVADRLGALQFQLTQEFLAEMIGSRRSTVTLTAGALKRSGLIDYRRGELSILDRAALEEVACECYPVTRKLLQSLEKPFHSDGKDPNARPTPAPNHPRP